MPSVKYYVLYYILAINLCVAFIFPNGFLLIVVEMLANVACCCVTFNKKYVLPSLL